MKVGISLLTVGLDRLGGLSLRLAAAIRGLAELGHQVVTLQTQEAFGESLDFYRSVKELRVSWITVDFQLGNGLLRWARLPLLWRYPWANLLPQDLDILDLWDPLVNVSRSRSYPIVFSHNHFPPYIWQHLRHCGPRSFAMFPEIPFLDAMLRGRCRRVDGYVTETDEQRRWLMNRYAIPGHLVAAVPPGFDAAYLLQAREAARHNENSSPAIVFSGRLQRWKGVHELVEAFSLLAVDHPSWRLHFVGDGPARAGLEQEVAEQGLKHRVVFWGSRPYNEALRIVASADVFVMPSYIESFGMSLVEAMALGIPVIATHTCGAKDYVIEEGITGLSVPAKDPNALQDALVRLTCQPELRKVIGSNAQEKVKGLTFANMVGATSKLYTRVADLHDCRKSTVP
jgi:glycosyltransferase involved in cell wall biosynthesis